MPGKCWMLLQDGQRHQIGCADESGYAWHAVETAADASVDAIVMAIAEQFQSLGYRGEGVAMALHSSLCLAAAFPLENHAAGRQRQTLIYQFEQYMPLAAEDMVADFIVDGCDAFGTAVPLADSKILVDALEQHGICIQSMSPLALLAVQHAAVPSGEPSLILWQQGDIVDWISVSSSGRPAAWRMLPAETTSLVQHLHAETFNRSTPLKVVAHACTNELIEAIAAVPNIQLDASDEQPMCDAAAKISESMLAGKTTPWIEYRRDGLGTPDPFRAVRGPMLFAAVAATAMAIAMIAGFSYRAFRYDQLSAKQQERQAAIYRQLFPGQATPVGIRSRLESEHAKLAGLKGDSSQLPTQTSAFVVLHDVLAAMPNDVRYRFHELRLNRHRVNLDGEVLSHSDADKISSGLRNRGFQVQPPRTQQLSGHDIAVRIAAELPQKAKKGAAP